MYLVVCRQRITKPIIGLHTDTLANEERLQTPQIFFHTFPLQTPEPRASHYRPVFVNNSWLTRHGTVASKSPQ